MGRWRQISEEMLRRTRELRERQTPAEEVLWSCLRGRQLAGIKFRRQHTVGRYILDFFTLEGRVGIELDGSVHQGREDIDAVRSRELAGLGVRMIRFSNEQVFADPAGVLRCIVEAVKSPSPPAPLPGERGARDASPAAPVPRGPSPQGEGQSASCDEPQGGEGLSALEARVEETNELEGMQG